MPRREEKRMKGQAPVRSEQFYNMTTPRYEVARPTSDVSIPAPQRSNDAEALLRFSGQFNEAQRAYAGMQKQRAAEAEDRGEAAALAGEYVPDDATNAFVKGYEKQEGRAGVADYIKAYDQLASKAHSLTPAEYDQESEKIDKQFMLGRSKDWLRGFVPSAMEHKVKYERAYTEQNNLIVKNNMLAGVRKIAYSEGKRILEDPSITDKGQALRDLLSEQQGLAKDELSLASRTEIAANFTDVFIDEAVRAGRPDYLLFAYQKDDSGLSLSQSPEMAAKIDDGLNRAISEAQRRDNLKKTALEKARKETVTATERSIVNALNSGDPAEIMKAEQSFKAAQSVLEPSALWKLHDAFNSLKDGNEGMWATITNEDLFTQLKIQAKFGDLGAEHLAGYRSNLTAKDGRTLLNDIVTRKEKAAADSKKTTTTKKSKSEFMIDDLEKSGVGMVTQKDQLGVFRNPLGAPMREGVFKLNYRTLLDTLSVEYGGDAKIPYQEILWARDKAAWMSYQPGTGVPAAGREAIPPDPDEQQKQKLDVKDPGVPELEDDPFWTQ